MAITAVLILSALVSIADAQAAEPEFAVPVSSISQKEVPDTVDPLWKGSGKKGSDLYWLCDVKACGPFVITVGRNCFFCTFERDVEKGNLVYKASSPGPMHNWDWYNLAVRELPDHDWIVYCTSMHDLTWLTLSHASGKLTVTGQLHLKAVASFPALSPDRQHLFAAGSSATDFLAIDATSGAPTLAGSSRCKGSNGSFSPDCKSYYAVDKDELYSYRVDASTGVLTELPVTPLPGGSDNRWAHVTVSPDGKFLYRPLASEIAVFERNVDSGVLAPKNSQKLGDIAAILQMEFTPDGRAGYFVCMGEGVKAKSSDCTGWLTRDPATGALTYAGQAPRHAGYTRLTADWEHGNLFTLIKMGPSTICSFKTPSYPEKPAR
jgi:6-phosphogluconolactonase (cycloisomerase 2 family)